MLSGNRNSNHRNLLFVCFFTLTWFNISDIDFVYQVSGTLFLGKNTQVSAHAAHQVDVLHLWDSAQLWAVVITLAGSLYTDAFEALLHLRSESQKVQHISWLAVGFWFLLENRNKCFFWNRQLPPKFCFGSYFFFFSCWIQWVVVGTTLPITFQKTETNLYWTPCWVCIFRLARTATETLLYIYRVLCCIYVQEVVPLGPDVAFS